MNKRRAKLIDDYVELRIAEKKAREMARKIADEIGMSSTEYQEASIRAAEEILAWTKATA